MNRKTDWQRALQDHMTEWSGRSFAPGRSDCALFVAAAIECMTGQDLARGHRGYRTLAEGRRRLVDRGFDRLSDLAKLSLAEIPPALAQRGDIAILVAEDLDDEAFGLVLGDRIAVWGPAGMSHVPLTSALRAYRVP